MFSKAPVNGNEDVLGALSLILYTLLLVPLVKYVLIVLLANDDGEGMKYIIPSLQYNVNDGIRSHIMLQLCLVVPLSQFIFLSVSLLQVVHLLYTH